MLGVMRIGLVGTDSTHTDKFVARWAGEHQLLLAEATRLPGELTGDPSSASAIRVVDTAADLVGLVDGAVVGHRRASQHQAAAVPLLEAGIPVFVDKPLAADLSEAEAVIAAAERGGAALASWSALRWSAAATLAGRLELTSVLMEGPADPASEFGGISFYGVHCADLAVALLGGPVESIEVRVGEGEVVTELTVRDVPATIVLRPPASMPGFRLGAQSRTGRLDRPIELKADYLDPVADLAAEIFATRMALQSRAELLDVVRITDAMDAAVAASRR